mmetsp:Transcript_46449/g.129261  ORF Transcript_46449/g.129261 Transcript_46449/m.129261 type:complete len:282 (-) Transcript_46449:466-1311(-)
MLKHASPVPSDSKKLLTVPTSPSLKCSPSIPGSACNMSPTRGSCFSKNRNHIHETGVITDTFSVRAQRMVKLAVAPAAPTSLLKSMTVPTSPASKRSILVFSMPSMPGSACRRSPTLGFWVLINWKLLHAWSERIDVCLVRTQRTLTRACFASSVLRKVITVPTSPGWKCITPFGSTNSAPGSAWTKSPTDFSTRLVSDPSCRVYFAQPLGVAGMPRATRPSWAQWNSRVLSAWIGEGGILARFGNKALRGVSSSMVRDFPVRGGEGTGGAKCCGFQPNFD